MKFGLLTVLLLFTFFLSNSQETEPDWAWWNELHGWEPGDPGWRNWIIISPGYLGPNALPVPENKKGILVTDTEFEISVSNHFHPGDPTKDISARIYIPFAQNRIAVEMWGVVFEQFAFSEQIRNERFARDYDGKGNATGDFYFSTLIQVVKDRKFPNTLFRFATKTASGNQLEAARYSDSPGYFFDLSFSKEIGSKATNIFRPFGLAGFYSWQTNDELNLQNDAFLYALGGDFEMGGWLFSGSFSGYSGYKNERDQPCQLNFELRKDLPRSALRLQYIHGLRDREYKTVKMSFVWKINSKINQ